MKTIACGLFLWFLLSVLFLADSTTDKLSDLYACGTDTCCESIDYILTDEGR